MLISLSLTETIVTKINFEEICNRFFTISVKFPSIRQFECFCRGDINFGGLLKPYTSIIIMLNLVVSAWVAVCIWLLPQDLSHDSIR
jgi:hypothetical protein